MKTRQEILSYRDQELINYYDECISTFAEYNKKWDKLVEIRDEFLKKKVTAMVVCFAWIIPLIFVACLSLSILSTYAPMPESDGSWIYERLGSKYESEEQYRAEMVKERSQYASSLL